MRRDGDGGPAAVARALAPPAGGRRAEAGGCAAAAAESLLRPARATRSVAARTASSTAAAHAALLELVRARGGRPAGRRHRGPQRFRARRLAREQGRRAEERLVGRGIGHGDAGARRARRPRSSPRRGGTRRPDPSPTGPVTASSCGSGTRTTTPTAPSTRSASSRSASVACAPGRDRGHAGPTSAGVFGIARTTGRPGARPRASAIATPAAIDSTIASSAEARRAPLERRRHVAGLHRDDHDVGVGDGPGRARHHVDAREALLEHPPPVGVDLGDRERLRLPARRRADRTSSASPMRPPPSKASAGIT